jgi:hypothetical protein
MTDQVRIEIAKAFDHPFTTFAGEKDASGA